MPEIHFDIPNAARWPELPLGDVCALISRGSAPVYMEQSDVAAIGQRCVTQAGFDAGKCRPHSSRVMTGVLRPEFGDVLLNSTGTGTIGRSCVFDSPGLFIVDGHVTDLRPSPAVLDGRWLNAILRSSWGQRHLERYCFSGSTNQVELNRVPLSGSRVPIPPLKEQRAAAEILDTLDTTIRQTEAIVEKLKQVKQGLLHDLLTRGTDGSGQLRPPQSQAPHLYKDSPLGWIPSEWTARALSEVVASTPNAIVDGPFGSNLKSEHYRSSGIPVIQSGYVTSGEFHAASYVYVTHQHFQAQMRSQVHPGDIVMAKIGANAGMCAVLPDDHEMGILAGNSMKITTDDLTVRRDWLVRYLHRLYQVTGMSEVRTETAQPAISLGRIRKLHIPVPQIVEQERASHSFFAVENSARLELETLNKLRTLKSGLIDDLLTGRVRVTPLLA